MPPDPATDPIPPLAADVLSRYKPGKDVMALHQAGQTSAGFPEVLISADRASDALRFWGHALSRRAAVWWACLGIEGLAAPTTPEDLGALAAARQWVALPDDDETRRAAMPAAEASGFETPSAIAAVAAYFSGGSLAPPDLPPVDPPSYMTGDSVGNSLTLVAVANPPEKAPERFQELLRLGREVADGKHAWPAPSEAK